MTTTEFIRFDSVRSRTTEELRGARSDLSVAQGEFLTLLGPSGSGKTTSLMMLAGFESPTAGDPPDARRIDHVPASAKHRRRVQNYALFPHMSVADNAFPLRMRGINGADVAKQVKRALDMVRLVGMDARRPAQLSGGQQQRVALARAMVFEPKLVLMDEQLGALDKQLREHMQLEIKALHRRLGINVVYVTHDQSEALTMSYRVGVFDQGVMQQLAPPEELYESPANLFVAQFIGEAHTLRGTLLDVSNGKCTMRVGDGTLVGARPDTGLAAAQPAALSLRPEKVRLLAEGHEPSDTLNAVPATLIDLVYHGDHTRLCLDTCGSADFLMKVPNDAALPALRPGARFTVGWDAAQCQALPLH
jgi:putative spermidine/putrescine transport system ATP-binding protein